MKAECEIDRDRTKELLKHKKNLVCITTRVPTGNCSSDKPGRMQQTAPAGDGMQ